MIKKNSGVNIPMKFKVIKGIVLKAFKKDYCCKNLLKLVEDIDDQNGSEIEFRDDSIAIHKGCDGCWTGIDNVKFCPFCGKKFEFMHT